MELFSGQEGIFIVEERDIFAIATQIEIGKYDERRDSDSSIREGTFARGNDEHAKRDRRSRGEFRVRPPIKAVNSRPSSHQEDNKSIMH